MKPRHVDRNFSYFGNYQWKLLKWKSSLSAESKFNFGVNSKISVINVDPILINFGMDFIIEFENLEILNTVANIT